MERGHLARLHGGNGFVDEPETLKCGQDARAPKALSDFVNNFSEERFKIMSTRRQFLQHGLGFVSLGLAMPTLLLQATRAVAQTPASKRGGKILVVIEMAGGNDALNTVSPIENPLYLKHRPNIAIKADEAVKIGGGLALNPSMKALGKLYERGQVAVLNGVGYPNPNRSHFQAMDIWQSGNPDMNARERTGWLARFFDEQGHFTGNQNSDSLGSLAFGGGLPLALTSPTSAASVIGNAYDFGFQPRGERGDVQIQTLKSLYQDGKMSGGTVAASAGDFIRNVGQEVYSSTDAIKSAFKTYDEKAGQRANYPRDNGLANGLQTVAKLITGDLPTTVYYLSIGGFDTHANQPGHHAYLLGQVSNAIGAFMEDLTLQGRANDVMVMTFSEFGRRVAENGSNGTDHGAAGVSFVVGGSVRGGTFGAVPALDDLDDGDLKFHTDFRSVYATILGGWLRTAPDKVLGGEFPTLKFV